MLLDKQEEVCDLHQRTLLLVPTDPVLAVGIQVLEGLQEEKELVLCILGVGGDWIRPSQLSLSMRWHPLEESEACCSLAGLQVVKAELQ